MTESGTTDRWPGQGPGPPEQLNFMMVDRDYPFQAATTPQSEMNESTVSSSMTANSQTEFLRHGTEAQERRLAELRDAGLSPSSGSISADQGCGYGRCRPKCLQKCSNIKLFIFFLSVLSLFSGSISAYFYSVITTIEKRFEIGSSLSGLIAASFEFGSLVAVIFVSYFGGRRHIPLWVGLGALCISIGALLSTLPHFIAEQYTIRGGLNVNTTDENICKSNAQNQEDLLANQMCVDEKSGDGVYVFILIIAQILVGAGGTPIYTLGTTYIDNHVTKEKAPSYIGFIYATGALAPVVGFGVGAVMLQYYVDTFHFDIEALNLSPNDPRWVGAWWGGFMVLGAILIIAAIPFYAFPRELKREKEKLFFEVKDKSGWDQAEDEENGKDYGKKIKDLPKAAWKLFTNAIYLLTSLGACCELAIVSGMLAFLPKYLEHQFQVNSSVSNLLIGGIAVPGAVLGVLVGGFLLRKLQLRPRGAIQMTLIFDVVSMCGILSFFYMGCDNLKIAGATSPYFENPLQSEFETNLTSICNRGCDCSNNDLELICGANGVTYFSPCHAGCTSFYAPKPRPNFLIHTADEDMDMHIKNYTDCACIVGNLSSPEVTVHQLAHSGPCPSNCIMMIPFMMVLFLTTFFVAGTQMPLLMVTMRSVDAEERAFCLGIQFVIIRLLANIPSPILFGQVIDTTCLLWKERCGKDGSCLMYDIEEFRYRYVALALGLKFLGFVLFVVVCVLIRRAHNREINKKMDIGEIIESLTSIENLHLRSSFHHDSHHGYRQTQTEDDEAHGREACAETPAENIPPPGPLVDEQGNRNPLDVSVISTVSYESSV